MFTKTSQRHFYNGLSGRKAERERDVAWHLKKKKKLQIEEKKIRNWKKQSSWLKLSWPLWYAQWIKGELVRRVWCLSCIIFFNIIFKVMRARNGEKFSPWMFSALAVEEQVWNVLQVSLQPSSGNSFPCTAFLPSKRQTSDAWGLLCCTGKSAAEKSIKLLYLKRKLVF